MGSLWVTLPGSCQVVGYRARTVSCAVQEEEVRARDQIYSGQQAPNASGFSKCRSAVEDLCFRMRSYLLWACAMRQ